MKHSLLKYLLPFFGITLIIYACLFLPNIFLSQQIEQQTNHILNSSSSYLYGYDEQSRIFLEQHPHLKINNVTESQGWVNSHLDYHVASTINKRQLGIIVYHYDPGLPFSKIKIHSIRVWNP